MFSKSHSVSPMCRYKSRVLKVCYIEVKNFLKLGPMVTSKIAKLPFWLEGFLRRASCSVPTNLNMVQEKTTLKTKKACLAV